MYVFKEKPLVGGSRAAECLTTRGVISLPSIVTKITSLAFDTVKSYRADVVLLGHPVCKCV